MNLNKKIFVWDYLASYKKDKKNILNVVNKVFNSGQLVLGNEVKNFENNFAKYVNCKYGIGVNSGTDALQIALMSIGVKKNDEIITVSNTAVPTVSAIVSCGAIPIYVDVNENDYLINTSLIEEKITKKTRAIIAVNLYGQSCDYEKINKIAEKYKIKVIEDCAQSTGSMYKNKPSGSFGDLSAFSFYPTKNLGAYGDGGMIVTNKKELYEKCIMLRKYGMSKNYYSQFHGVNSRLDEIQATILNFKLKKLNNNINKRRAIAKIYNKNLCDTDLILPKENHHSHHSYYAYVVRHNNREKIMKYLRSYNIYCNISYPFPIHSMKGYRHLTKNHKLKITNKLSKQIFSLPMYPELTFKMIEKILKVLKKF